jgi:hypothetical protein
MPSRNDDPRQRHERESYDWENRGTWTAGEDYPSDELGETIAPEQSPERWRGNTGGRGGWEGFRDRERGLPYNGRTSAKRPAPLSGWSYSGQSRRGMVSSYDQGYEDDIARGADVERHWSATQNAYSGAAGPLHEPVESQPPGASLRGGFRGRGPKNFRRSDERIRELACERLEDHDEVDATDIEVSVSEGEITLSGAVSDRRMKRMAEDAISDLPGVRDVHNKLKFG